MLDLQASTFAILKENLILLGRDRDLIVYDRLLKKELFVIPNVSFTGLWKDIIALEIPNSVDSKMSFIE